MGPREAGGRAARGVCGFGTPTALFPCLVALLLTACSNVGNGGGGSGPSAKAQDPPLTIVTTALPAGEAGVSYQAALVATGGTAPYAWSVASGTLPAGLSLAAATGTISGVPQGPAGTTSLTFTITDSGTGPASKSITLPLTINAAAGAPLSIVTTSLPGGNVGLAYAANLVATGGVAPLSWKLTAGTLPPGLGFTGATGLVSGVPTSVTSGTSLTFTVTDSAAAPAQRSVTLTLVISPTIGVAVSPARAALTVTQALKLSATTSDAAGVKWSVSPAGGSFSSATSASGTSVTYTAPATAGVYTLTATSVSDATQKGSITVGVTDLAGVYTWHNDLARDGVNAREFALTTGSVTRATFGKLFSCTVDGAIYGQPLWVANLLVGLKRHNVVFVGTAQDSLYAFDADASPCNPLWRVSLIDAAHGGAPGETTSLDLAIVGTPVIDPAAGILYVATKSWRNGTQFARLHALDLASGSEKPGSPIAITPSVPANNGPVAFNPSQHTQRCGLALYGNTVYVAYGSYGDIYPWFGWLIGYTYANGRFVQSAVFNAAPNGVGGGIWMSGGAPSIDDAGNLYVITGNGDFDASSGGVDFGDSFLQLSGALHVKQYFTPADQATDNSADFDFGSGGATVLLNPGAGPVAHVVVGGGKDGALYVLNGDKMGGLAASAQGGALQRLLLNAQIYEPGAFWNNTFYIGPSGQPLQAFRFDPATDQLSPGPAPTATSFNEPGAGLSISTSGSAGTAIVWVIDSSTSCPSPCGPAVLHAYDATNLGAELWNSNMVAADVAGHAVKFAVPTVANGRVYVGTRGTDSAAHFNASSSTTGELDVYGLKPD